MDHIKLIKTPKKLNAIVNEKINVKVVSPSFEMRIP